MRDMDDAVEVCLVVATDVWPVAFDAANRFV
jgi:hypothetical protein